MLRARIASGVSDRRQLLKERKLYVCYRSIRNLAIECASKAEAVKDDPPPSPRLRYLLAIAGRTTWLDEALC
jgi:hypothetical protein